MYLLFLVAIIFECNLHRNQEEDHCLLKLKALTLERKKKYEITTAFVGFGECTKGTIMPHMTQKPHIMLPCNGDRSYGGIQDYELGIGMPAKHALYALENLFKAGKVQGMGLIIFTSDHGDYNGDHGLIRKFTFMFDNILKVPFLIRLPNQVHASTIYKGNTQHEDIVPSLFEYLNISIPDDVQGESFASVLSNGVNGKSREYSFFEYYKYAIGVSKGPWKLIYYPPKNWPWKNVPQIENSKEMFQIVSLPKWGNGFVLTNSEEDPLEYDNLIDDEAHLDIENELKDALFKWVIDTPLYYPKKPYTW